MQETARGSAGTKKGSSSSAPRPSSSGRAHADRQRSRTPVRQVHLEPNKISGLWKGGEGKYGAIKKISTKAADVKMEEYVGGLRDPYKVVLPRSNMLTIGLKIRAAWELFERQFKEASRVGEQYGTKECSLDDKLIVEWRARLKKVVGAQAPPAVRVTHKWIYKSPLQAEIIKAWIEKGNDPDKYVPEWIEHGAPLGIERPIETAGILTPPTTSITMAVQSWKTPLRRWNGANSSTTCQSRTTWRKRRWSWTDTARRGTW